MHVRAWVTVLFALGVVACSSAPTEVLVVVSSDLAVPAELDEVVVTVTHPDGVQTRQATATLGAGQLPLPRSLGLVHEGGPLGLYRVLVEGRRAGAAVIAREGTLEFVPNEIRVWRVALDRACLGVACPSATCAGGACRDVRVGEGELEPYAPDAPGDAGVTDAGGGPPDAGTDAGSACAPDCAAGACVCEGGCTCAMGCPALDCDATCRGAGTVCTVAASPGSDAALRCVEGARCTVDARSSTGFDLDCAGRDTSCDVDCTGSSNCGLRCSMGAACILRCATATGCGISPCAGGATDCGGGVFACGTACP